jgi:hypothetical protein
MDQYGVGVAGIMSGGEDEKYFVDLLYMRVCIKTFIMNYKNKIRNNSINTTISPILKYFQRN